MNRKIRITCDPFIKDFIDTLITDYGVNEEEEDLYKTWLEITDKRDLVEEEESCRFVLTRGEKKGEFCSNKKGRDSEVCGRHKSMVKKNVIILKKHITLKKFWDPVSKLVYEDNTGKVVIGKTTKSTKGESCPILPLNEKDIETCKTIGVEYKQKA